MVQAMLNTSVCCSILSHDVSKFVYFIPQLRNLKTVKSCTLKGFFINNIYNLINECLKGKARGVFSLFSGKGGNRCGEERALYLCTGFTLELGGLILKG